MSQRLTRKDIKHDIRDDEVRSVLVRVFDLVQERPRVVAGAVAGFVILVLAVTGLLAYRDHRADRASEELAQALRIAGAPVNPAGPAPEDTKDPSFASEDAKRGREKEAFAEVRSVAGSSIAGEIADLYLADLAAKEGDVETARGIWKGFLADHENHVLALSVRLNLIHLDRQNGRTQEVADELRRELDSAAKTLPEDVILFELAQTLQQLDQDGAALELYQRILDEHPKSPYTAEARRVTTAASS